MLENSFSPSSSNAGCRPAAQASRQVGCLELGQGRRRRDQPGCGRAADAQRPRHVNRRSVQLSRPRPQGNTPRSHKSGQVAPGANLPHAHALPPRKVTQHVLRCALPAFAHDALPGNHDRDVEVESIFDWNHAGARNLDGPRCTVARLPAATLHIATAQGDRSRFLEARHHEAMESSSAGRRAREAAET